jgi:hypothetical protein
MRVIITTSAAIAVAVAVTLVTVAVVAVVRSVVDAGIAMRIVTNSSIAL